MILLGHFASSLRGVPIAERFARAQAERLSPAQIAYCRSVTVIWCVFFVLNGGVTAALALRAPLGWWAAYSGAIAYGLVGLLLASEYCIRKYRFRNYGRHFVDRALARVFPPLSSPASEDVS
jgi:uncharacterized membrane protein